MRLTKDDCRLAEAVIERPYKLADGGGLYGVARYLLAASVVRATTATTGRTRLPELMEG